MLLEDANKVLKDYIGAKNDLALSKSDKKLAALNDPKEFNSRMQDAVLDMDGRIGFHTKQIEAAQKLATNQLGDEITLEVKENIKFQEIAQKYPKAEKPSDEVRREAANAFKEELKNYQKGSQEYKDLNKKLDTVKPKTWATVKFTAKDMASKIRDRLGKGDSMGKSTNSPAAPPTPHKASDRARSSSQSR